MLQGHERSITQIKFNEEGDLLFSASKDVKPNVWYSINGERLGTYDGHTGTIWSIDIKWDSSHFITGSADQTIRYELFSKTNLELYNILIRLT